MPRRKSTSKYEIFAAYYVGEARFNATTAAELAGFKAKNRHSLQVQASQMLERDDVQEFIRNHVNKVAITQDELLEELADMARWNWQENVEYAAGSMENAKVFDTLMRAKLTAVSSLVKLFSGDLQKEIEKLRQAVEQHRAQFPEMTDDERAGLFKAHIDPKLVDQVFFDLMKSDANQKRLAAAEADTADPMGAGR